MLKHADKYLSPNTVPLQKTHHEILLLLNIGCVSNEYMLSVRSSRTGIWLNTVVF